MDTFQQITGLLIDQVDFADDQFEQLTETVLTSGGGVMLQANVIDQVKGDTDTTETVGGLVSIAKTVGKAFGNLSPDDKQALKGAIAQIVSYPDNPALEGALEGLFNSYIDLLDAVKALNDYVASVGQ